MKAGLRDMAAWPWHLVLVPLVPLVYLVSDNLAYTLPAAALPVGARLACAAGLAALLLSLLSRRPQASALVTSLVLVAWLSYLPVARLRETIASPAMSILALVWAALVSAFLYTRRRETLRKLTTWANLTGLLAIVLAMPPILTAQFAILRMPGPRPIEAPGAGRILQRQSPPDIYIVILDGYGREDTLNRLYGFKSELEGVLNVLGFDIAGQANSNYIQTTQSLASALNVDYLPALTSKGAHVPPARHQYVQLIRHNRFFAALRNAGYRVVAFPSEYSLISMAGVDRTLSPRLWLTELDAALYSKSYAPSLSALMGRQPWEAPLRWHRRQIMWTISSLNAAISPGDPPTAVFLHLLVPHPPFAFEPDGSLAGGDVLASINDGSHWRSAGDAGQTYEAGYRRSVRFLDSQLAPVIRRLVEAQDGRPKLIYIQGDHGPGSHLDWSDMGASDLPERFGILLAGYDSRTPRADWLPDDVTPVNSFRRILNRSLQLDLPSVADRSFFSKWKRPDAFKEATHLLHGSPKRVGGAE